MQIRPMMQNLPKLVDTYKNVCGQSNPFSVPGGSWYFDPGVLHNYMLVFHGDLPVMNDYARLTQQIALVLTENVYKYAAMDKALEYVNSLENLTSEFSYTETTTRTGHDDLTKTGTETNTRTGNVADGGTDSTTDTSTITDSTVTYDNGTLRDTAKSTHGGGVSVTHGKTTTYNNVADAKTYAARKDETAYNSTFTKSVSGHKMAPAEIMEQYMEFVRNNNLFTTIIADVVKAISCVVYIPVIPENVEEE